MYDVEWIESVPVDEYGDADLDRPDTRYRHFPNRGLALAFARRTVKRDDIPFGVAYIQEYREATPAEVKAAMMDDDFDGDYWREGGRLYLTTGPREEVSA